MASPYTRAREAQFLNVAAGADLERIVAKAPVTGTVVVKFVPDTALTGANTDSRTFQAFNKTASNTKIAEKAYTSGVNIAAAAEDVVTAVAPAACTAGDMISFKSLHVGGTGLASPTGMVIIEFVAST